MQANPDKFQSIAVGKKSFAKNPVFKTGSNSITCEKTVKLLGVDIDFKLNFNFHIGNICKQAGRQLNILQRLGNNLNKLNKLTIFHTFILSNFNFCPMAWHFCSEYNTKKMEKLQERALRFVYNDYSSSYKELLTKVNLPSLHIRRMRIMAMQTYRIFNEISPVVLSDLVIKRNSSFNFRYSNILQVPRVKTTTYGVLMPMPAGVIRKPHPYDEIYIPESEESEVMPMPECVRRKQHSYDEVDIPDNEGVLMPMPAGVIRKPHPYDEIFFPESEVMPMPEGVRRKRHSYDEVDIPDNEVMSMPDGVRRKRHSYDEVAIPDNKGVLMPMPAGVIRKPHPYDEIYIPESEESEVLPMAEGVRRKRHSYDKVDIPDNEDTSIPDELQYDPRTRELYEKAVKEGREEDSTLRVMVIGCFGQGKTSLTRRLRGQTLDMIETTDGIEVDTCTVHEDSKLKRGSKDYHESDYLKRIAVIANNTQNYTETAVPKEDHLRSESKNTAYPEDLSKPQAFSETGDNK
ncbi:uncharacterized protein LOC123548413 isoform X3 [Mercenaria mercenaria]|uniref:uncharacterized protein LOC123548413 isoform X3 n=1 Tax=Mercenaria mercenaria TaxID=6596 RepID=UPI00234F82D1|nr:uncharacterized protein LOC123548413 isoform X3 [Mercenaria mercenaria]